MIEKNGGFWLAGVAIVLTGCSGRVLDNSAASAGSAGRAPSAEDERQARAGSANAVNGGGGSTSVGVPSTAGDAGADAGPGNPEACTGTLAEAADALGFSCPMEFCAAQLLGSDCSTLPAGTIKTRSKSCQSTVDTWSISFEISPTRHKACYYTATFNADGPPVLVGATAWDDLAEFCGGTATTISGGSTAMLCVDPSESTLCDLAHPSQQQPRPDSPPRACFNSYGHACEPCCAETPPDCSHEPEGYPGYECTPLVPGESQDYSYCSCSCRGGSWACSC